MAEKLSWVFYDEVTLDTSANEKQAFASAMGSSSTRTRNVTNSPGASTMRPTEAFLLKKIRVYLDSLEVVADIEKILPQSYLRLNILDREVFNAPLSLLGGAGTFQGEFHEATNTLARMINLAGNGYDLMIPLIIPLGSKFEVFVGQGTALANNTQLKVCLEGELTRN